MARRLKIEEVLEKIENRNPGKYEIIEDLNNYTYSNVHQKISIRCKTCKHEYDKRINDLLHGYGCNKCANVRRYTVDEMKQRVIDIDPDYTLISDTNRTRNVATFKHHKCNKEFKMVLNNFINNGERCPLCNIAFGNANSRGIVKIKNYLDSKNISYIQEYRFDKCRNKGQALPFDIFIESLNTIIEFDGLQHFKPVKVFGGEEAFLKRQENDKIKNKFAAKNNIKLIRISYEDETNIDNILKENGI